MTAVALARLLVGAEIGLAATMILAWAIQRATGNSGWIDACWTFGVGVFGASLALWGGASWRAWPVALGVAIWSARLGRHIALRTLRAGDDARYAKLRQEWGAAAPRRLFLFLQSQALVGAGLVFCVALAARNPAQGVRAQDVLGFVILAGALVGEAMADRQLDQFKQNPAHRGGICDVGLWSRSRHPNYFFEWLVWLAYPIIAIDLSGGFVVGWLALFAPAVMYWTLRYASGVPPLEDHMMRTRPAAFEAYRAKTPVFFPRLF